MAISKAQVKATYPLPSYNYKVEIGGTAIAFSEVTGLNIHHDTATYKELARIPVGKVPKRIIQAD